MKIESKDDKDIELAAESFARLLIQQITYKKNSLDNNKIENKYGKSNS